MLQNKRLILSLVLASIAAIFILQNTEVVQIHFLFWQFSMSRVLFIFVLVLIGVVIGWLLHSLAHHRK